MIILLMCLLALLTILYGREFRKRKQMEKEFQYIHTQIEHILRTQEVSYILLPSEHSVVNETIKDINLLLESMEDIRVRERRNQTAMLQLFTDISHDLRTPITVLKGYIEMLYIQSEKERLSKPLHTMIEKLHRNAEELVHMVQQLLQMAKLRSGDTHVELQSIELTSLCHDVLLQYYDLLEKKQMQVEIDWIDTPLHANIDADAVSRILHNLIDNAVRYGESGHYLAIHLYPQKEEVCIAVEDHGIGITKEEERHIFTRAYTLDHTHGNGLGLAIAQELAKRMGGYISVNSTPHEKTVFTLHLQC